MLVDCHCHLHDAVFDQDREAVVLRAKRVGVSRAVVMAEGLSDGRRVLEVCQRADGFLLPALGVHPDRASMVADQEIEALIDLAVENRARLAAIGEVGLDFRRGVDAEARGRQLEVFRAMIRLAGQLDLPLSVHSRSAGHHAIRVLQEMGAKRVCLHAFDGRATYGAAGAEAGYFFSFPPSLARSVVKQKLARRLPARALLLESDSPALGPEPSGRNEPVNLRGVLSDLAELRATDEFELADVIGTNTARLFCWGHAEGASHPSDREDPGGSTP